MSSDDIPLHCAYCGEKMSYFGTEIAAPGSSLVRHHYACPRCGQVWVLGPRGNLEVGTIAPSAPIPTDKQVQEDERN